MTSAFASPNLHQRIVAASQTPTGQAIGLILCLYLLGYLR